MRVPSSSTLRTRSSWRASCRSSGDRSGASASVTVTPGPAGGAAPRPHRDTAVLRGLHDVVDDEEIPGVAGVRDDAQLVVEPLLNGAGQGVAVAHRRTGAREVHQEVVVGRELGRPRVLRQEVALLEVELASLGDARGLGQDLGVIRKQRRHLRLGLYVALLAEEPEPVGVVQVLSRADGEQHVVRFGVLFLQVVGVDRKSTRLNSSHTVISYAVFCLKKKNKEG